MFDLFLCLMIYNLWGHFNILIHNLDHFPRPAEEVVDVAGEARSVMYSQTELHEVAVLLKESIQYHKLIYE